MSTMALKENKMGTMPINKLLITVAGPMIISMIVQALYNIVDSIFVSMINENALTAVSLAFPIQNMLIAVGTGTGVGINSMLSKALGAKDQKTVDRVANNGLFLCVISFLLFLIVGLFFSKPFFASQTNDPQIYEYGVQYTTIVCTLSFGLFSSILFERLLQSTGRTVYSMIVQGVGAVVNIIMDPILIFGYLGFPAMGVAGAAIATVLGQIVAGALGVYFNSKKNPEIHLSVKNFRPHGKTIATIYKVGFPSIIMQTVGAVMNYCMNLILISFTSTATAVFGAYYKIQSLIFMPIFGLNNGMIPIIAYNFGAKKRSRVIKTIKLSVAYAVAIMFLGIAVFHGAPQMLLKMFNASKEMVDIGVPAFRIVSIAFLFAGYCIIVGSVFQALGNGVYSLAVSIARQVVVLLPAAYLLSKVSLEAVWWSFPIAEVMSLAATTFFLVKIYKNTIRHIPDEV